VPLDCFDLSPLLSQSGQYLLLFRGAKDADVGVSSKCELHFARNCDPNDFDYLGGDRGFLIAPMSRCSSLSHGHARRDDRKSASLVQSSRIHGGLIGNEESVEFLLDVDSSGLPSAFNRR
jgi:hypothetical protein